MIAHHLALRVARVDPGHPQMVHASIGYRSESPDDDSPLAFECVNLAADVTAFLGLPSGTRFRPGDSFDFEAVIDPEHFRKAIPC